MELCWSSLSKAWTFLNTQIFHNAVSNTFDQIFSSIPANIVHSHKLVMDVGGGRQMDVGEDANLLTCPIDE